MRSAPGGMGFWEVDAVAADVTALAAAVEATGLLVVAAAAVPQAALSVEIRGARHAAAIAPLPFYKRAS